jgi:hypothetical protein
LEVLFTIEQFTALTTRARKRIAATAIIPPTSATSSGSSGTMNRPPTL